MNTEIYEGMWACDGCCAPPENGAGARTTMMQTFTLGCFQYVRRGKDGQGDGLKRGRVRHRVKGQTSDPAPAYAEARAYCAAKNAEGASR